MRWRQLLEIIALGIMWGPSFLFVKLGIRDLSPITLVAMRVGLGALLLYVLLKIRGASLPRSRQVWGKLAIAGFFASSLPFMLFAFSELRITSVMAGVVNGSTPIFTAILAHWCIPNERLTLRRVIGVLLGVVGFTLLLLPIIITHGFKGDALGMTGVAIASISYAIGFVYVRKYVPQLPPLVGPAAMLIVSAAYLLPLAVIAEPLLISSQFTPRALLSVCGLALFGTACAYWLYYRVIARSGPVALSMALYVMTFCSVLLGRWVLGEKLSWIAYVAGIFILLGMVVVNLKQRSKLESQAGLSLGERRLAELSAEVPVEEELRD